MISDKMARKNFRGTTHKSPKFREFDDEDFCWEDKLELLKYRKKIGKQSRGQKKLKPMA